MTNYQARHGITDEQMEVLFAQLALRSSSPVQHGQAPEDREGLKVAQNPHSGPDWATLCESVHDHVGEDDPDVCPSTGGTHIVDRSGTCVRCGEAVPV